MNNVRTLYLFVFVDHVADMLVIILIIFILEETQYDDDLDEHNQHEQRKNSLFVCLCRSC
jgi:hypothetical protein